jgi:hypothetical protein
MNDVRRWGGRDHTDALSIEGALHALVVCGDTGELRAEAERAGDGSAGGSAAVTSAAGSLAAHREQRSCAGVGDGSGQRATFLEHIAQPACGGAQPRRTIGGVLGGYVLPAGGTWADPCVIQLRHPLKASAWMGCFRAPPDKPRWNRRRVGRVHCEPQVPTTSKRPPKMRMRGLEPPRSHLHTDLNRARLPIPPHPLGWARQYRTGSAAAPCSRELARVTPSRTLGAGSRRACSDSLSGRSARRHRLGD